MALNWDGIEGFSKNEFAPPVKPDHDWEMHPEIMDALSSIRRLGIYKYKDFRILIHTNGGYSVDGHSKKSLHYQGRASDFHMEHYSDNHKCWALVPWLDQVMLLNQAVSGENYGVGLHPNWNQQGFHLDYRLGIKGGAVWWDRGGKYKTYGHQSFGDAVMDVLYYEFKKQDAGV